MMNYSCGYWRHASTLEEAQTAKMELICRKLDLQPGMKVLDIGCGWGGLCRYMHEHYQADVTGISVASEQIRYAKEHDPEQAIHWLCDDYRNLTGSYDRIVSVGMFEHVGRKNYATYMQKVRSLLKKDGLFLLHTIGANYQKSGADPWINKYIFPNGMLPAPVSLSKAFSGLFVLEDWHNFGADYDRTLMAWYERFEKGLKEGGFTCHEEVRRMYRYYLLSCAGAFRARDIQLWQLVLSPHGVDGGYRGVRNLGPDRN
ncbi:MAG TPA: cyclopropane fatty acyl phospholipid synthase [Candidatus Desulfovibrio intestinipullorum]|uniref:Cyclopropane fatty acyl phospholipid synthase n=1 Tax=Candidatus Desulfovibrio intestinipullorum TaxID=2838536 RepID=A0A9D1PVV6_9BACT|nr:cyclopropane fatty acyl phospholipid synthase [Candidatus Desulfovibrio intestinipullorum]